MNEDANLAEVKAVLRRIQHLDPASAAPASTPEAPAANSSREVPAVVALFEAKSTNLRKLEEQPRASRRRPFIMAAIVASLSACAVAGVWLYLQEPQRKPGTSSLAKPTDGIAGRDTKGVLKSNTEPLQEARRLLNLGDVAGARNVLSAPSTPRTADAAFALAQSYDPNYLSSLPAANAPANKAEAERWYRTWYDLARGSGLEMDPERLNRIVKAMP